MWYKHIEFESLKKTKLQLLYKNISLIDIYYELVTFNIKQNLILKSSEPSICRLTFKIIAGYEGYVIYMFQIFKDSLWNSRIRQDWF